MKVKRSYKIAGFEKQKIGNRNHRHTTAFEKMKLYLQLIERMTESGVFGT